MTTHHLLEDLAREHRAELRRRAARHLARRAAATAEDQPTCPGPSAGAAHQPGCRR
ncbi:hypothetical protein [Nocardioides sp. 1609]|uniref:hypothetical protein n=1 Tax=Nocardioides sp. 1609 TaxID=2508327 RepID=UPI0014312235|nr:hypothetical protein [Nocardioides sp. 1609]